MSPMTSIPVVRVSVAIGVSSRCRDRSQARQRPRAPALAMRRNVTRTPHLVGGNWTKVPVELVTSADPTPSEEVVPRAAVSLEETSMSTIGEQLVHVLRQAGVTRVYGVVGDSLNPFVDAIRRTEGIEWIHVRNEEAGAFAAAAEAQLTGRLAVCAGSCGPGNTHLIQGLYDAHRSGAPVLAIASHIPTEQI